MSIHVAGHPVPLDPRSLWVAVRVEIARQSLAFKAWMAFLSLLVGVLAVTALISLPPGWEVFGTTPAYEWGLLIAAYVFFVVTTSGLCLVSALGQVFGVKALQPVAKRAVVLALLFLFAGFIVIALDLHYPIRLLFGVVMSPALGSAMWWMGVLYAIYMVFLLVELYGMFFGHERIAKVGSTLAFGNALLAPATLGMVFGALAARPYWNGALVPVQLIATALLSGASVLAVVFALVGLLRLRGSDAVTRVVPAIAKVLGVVLAIGILFTIWQQASELMSTVPGRADAARAVLFGPLALQYWIVKVGIGLVAPLVLLAWPRARTPIGLLAAGAMTFAGVFVDRLVLVSAGQIARDTTASGIVSYGHAAYTPSLVEIGLVIGAAGFVAMAYTLAERYLDLEEHGRDDDAVELEPTTAGAA